MSIPMPGETGGGCAVPSDFTADAAFMARINNDITTYWITALEGMSDQVSTLMLEQMLVVGSFLDAKHQARKTE